MDILAVFSLGIINLVLWNTISKELFWGRIFFGIFYPLICLIYIIIHLTN